LTKNILKKVIAKKYSAYFEKAYKINRTMNNGYFCKTGYLGRVDGFFKEQPNKLPNHESGLYRMKDEFKSSEHIVNVIFLLELSKAFFVIPIQSKN
jgi:hypothetical protein